jgi:hypothetical protein
MYGILAACIAVMAVFLGLFALSVESETRSLQDTIVVGSQHAGTNNGSDAIR